VSDIEALIFRPVCSTEPWPYAGFFHQGGSKAYMPKRVPNTPQKNNNAILKIVNGRLYSFRFAVSDSHSDSNMKIDLCLAYKMPNFLRNKLVNQFHSSSEHYAFNKCILKALAQNVKSGKIAKDRQSRREFMLGHIVVSDRQNYISLCKAKYPL
jgi:hypothetical protein